VIKKRQMLSTRKRVAGAKGHGACFLQGRRGARAPFPERIAGISLLQFGCQVLEVKRGAKKS
jgi:hypothetical protein